MARACLSPGEIAALAGGAEASAEQARHIDHCDTCRAEITRERDDASFLARMRSLVTDEPPPTGAPRLQGYGIRGVISSGSQGVVYLGEQESTNRSVAIKVLDAGSGATSRQRLRAFREAEIAAGLRHPNVVSVYESRQLECGRIAVVMEFVQGQPIDRWSAQAASDDPARVLGVFADVCEGVHHAHLNGVIHRDLKPDNVLVTDEDRPVVLDFGIARAGSSATVTGEFAGTPAYASPEQASGDPDAIDALTDVYSLGVLLYRLVCGRMPYTLDGSLFEIAQTIRTATPRAMEGVASDLQAIIRCALAKERGDRYQSAAALGNDIGRFLAGEPVEARSGSGWYLMRKAISINKGRISVGAAVAAALVTVLVIAVLGLRDAATQRQAAENERVRSRAVSVFLRESMPNRDPSVPGATTALDAGLARLHQRLESGAYADEPEVDQAIRRLWASVYTGFGGAKAPGLIAYSEISLRNGLVRLRAEHGAEHPEIASALHELAGVLLVRQRLDEAESIAADALAMRIRLHGPQSTEAAQTRSLRAFVLHELGEHDRATAEARLALQLYAGHNDASPTQIASLQALLGTVAIANEDLESAREYVELALVARLAHLAPEDPELHGSLVDASAIAVRDPSSELAAAIRDAWGADIEALPQALGGDILLLAGPDRGSFHNIVLTGRADALGRLLRLQRRLLGEAHPALVTTLLAQVKAAESEQLLELRASAALEAAEILGSREDAPSLAVLMCLDEAAIVLAYTDRPGRAVEIGERALAIWESLPTEAIDSLLAANCRRRLAWYCALDGQHEQAIGQFETALGELRESVGEDHHTTALTESQLAVSLCATGAIQRADEVSARALSKATSLEQTPPDQLALIRFARGHVLVEMARYPEGLGLLEQAWEPYFRLWVDDFVWREKFINDAARACEAQGDALGASRWRSQAKANAPQG